MQFKISTIKQILENFNRYGHLLICGETFIYTCFETPYMKYDAKSIIIGRKKRKSEDDDVSPCFIALFKINKPHTSGQVPEKILDFDAVRKVTISGLNCEYQLSGSDIVIDNLAELLIKEDGNVVHISGKQK